jgi:hypothetical protein
MRFRGRPGYANLHGRPGRLNRHNRRLAVRGPRSIRWADSGIVGQTVGIVCGGPSSEQGCLRRPVIATIDIRRLPSQQHIATVRTDNRGHFRRNLPPGTYKLQARTPSQLVWARAVTERILTHQTKHTTIQAHDNHLRPAPPPAGRARVRLRLTVAAPAQPQFAGAGRADGVAQLRIAIIRAQRCGPSHARTANPPTPPAAPIRSARLTVMTWFGSVVT